MFIKRNKKAQSTAEYAIVIALVVAAVLAMQVYVRRSLQGRIKQAADFTAANITDESGCFMFTFNADHYEPNYTRSDRRTTQTGERGEALKLGGGLERDESTNIDVTGIENISYE